MLTLYASGSTLLTIFGGRVKDLRPFLTEERLPDGWQPRIRHQKGLTMMEFNNVVLKVELGIKEETDGSLTAAGRERYRAGGAQGKKAAQYLVGGVGRT